jgi:tetratricopeptide (TPR) repeat protein
MLTGCRTPPLTRFGLRAFEKVMKSRTDRKANGLAGALAELRAGRLNAAEDISRRLLASAPRDPALHQLSAAISLRRGDFESAARWARSCLVLWPNHAPALVIAGRAARASGDLAEALACFRRAAELAPARSEPAFMTCVTLLERGDAEAHEMLKRLLRLFPDDAEGWHELGVTLRKANQLEGALVAFTHAASVAPNAIYRLHQGTVLQALGRAKEAIVAFQKALEVAPDLMEALVQVALCQRQIGEPRAACVGLEQVVAFDERNSHAWFALGMVRDDLHDFQGAILAYRKAVELRPDFAEAQVNLGLSLQRSGDLEMAMDAYRQAVRARADTFGRIAQALTSARKGQLWLDLKKLRRSLGV